MTEKEYNEQVERVNKYHDYEMLIRNLESKKQQFSHGIEAIKFSGGICDFKPDEEYYGEGFETLLVNKMVEACNEQMNLIKAHMEEI